jgi:multidrug resistance efflux pump
MGRCQPLVGLLLLIAAIGCGRLAEEVAGPAPTPTPLPTFAPARPVTTATRATIAETIRANGRVAPRVEATLYFTREGRLAQLHAEIGQSVKKGELLAALDTGELGGQLEKARLGLDVARIELQRTVERTDGQADPELRAAAAQIAWAETLRAEAVAGLEPRPTATANASPAPGTAPSASPTPADPAAARTALGQAEAYLLAARDRYAQRSDAVNASPALALVAANADLQLAVKRVELADVDLREFERRLNESRLEAPFDGVVTSANGRLGENVKPFEPTVTVADPSALVVTLDLPAQDTAKIAVGQPATITLDAFKGQAIPSKVVGLPGAAAGVAPPSGAKPGAGSGNRVVLELSPPGPVDLDAPASATIVARQKENALVVPANAVRREGDRTFVQILEPDGSLHESDVAVGIRTDQSVEIVAGLAEGAQVVAAG